MQYGKGQSMLLVRLNFTYYWILLQRQVHVTQTQTISCHVYEIVTEWALLWTRKGKLFPSHSAVILVESIKEFVLLLVLQINVGLQATEQWICSDCDSQTQKGSTSTKSSKDVFTQWKLQLVFQSCRKCSMGKLIHYVAFHLLIHLVWVLEN